MEIGPHQDRLEAQLAELGLALRGGFQIEAGEAPAFAIPGEAWLLLVGQVGPSLEGLFRSKQMPAQSANPLDEWTQSVIDPLAASFNGQARYPFSGPPFLPFEDWALRAGGVYRSPLGLLIHPKYGLWHAYRAALLLPGHWSVDPPKTQHPCEQCSDRPCLHSCPVGAFTGKKYDAASCRNHLHQAEAGCMNHGCESRRACPVGARYHYGGAQTRFHMRAFKSAH